MEKIRQVKPKIVYSKKDITKDLAPYLLSLTYTDYAHGKADDLELRLADPEKLWLSDWYPVKGDKIEASLEVEGVTLRCGMFEVDKIEVGGPPGEITIRAQSAIITKDLRLTKRTKAWENTSLQAISQEIANRAGLTLLLDRKAHV